MTFRAWLGLVLALAWLTGCTALQGPAAPGRFPAESIELPAHVPTYATRAQPDTAAGTGGEKLRADIAAALAQRGAKAELDGALSSTASWGLREVHEGRGVDLIGAEAASRHFGFGGVVMVFMAFDTRSDETWREQLERAPRNLPINRYGVRTSPSGQSAAVVFGSVEVSYEPIPRLFEPGEQVSLKGQVAPRFAFSHVYLTKPDGKVAEQRMPSRALDATFTLEAIGKYRLEVMGDGPSGPVVVSNVPLYVGIPEPAAAGHRANMLRAEFTHVGIGATKNDNGLVVTMVFGRRPSPDAMPTSSAQVARAIVALRAGKGLLTPGSADEAYSAGAQAGADALANGDAPSAIGNAVQGALQRAVNRLHTSRPGGCVASLDLLELSQLNEIPSLGLPGLKRFGVGARVRRDEKGARLSTVFMFEGVPCK